MKCKKYIKQTINMIMIIITISITMLNAISHTFFASSLYIYIYIYTYIYIYIYNIYRHTHTHVLLRSPRAYKFHGTSSLLDELCTINTDPEFFSYKYFYLKQLQLKLKHQGKHVRLLDLDITI